MIRSLGNRIFQPCRVQFSRGSRCASPQRAGPWAPPSGAAGSGARAPRSAPPLALIFSATTPSGVRSLRPFSSWMSHLSGCSSLTKEIFNHIAQSSIGETLKHLFLAETIPTNLEALACLNYPH